MTEHHLKCLPEYFWPLLTGTKKHETRRDDDRHFRTGDVLVLKEFVSQGTGPDGHSIGTYTGRELRRKVTYISEGGSPGIEAGYVVMSVEPEEKSAPHPLSEYHD
jgi:hypothetical protein